MGPLRPDSVAAVQAFMRCGDPAAGFTRLLCTACGHQHLLAFTCKARHLFHTATTCLRDAFRTVLNLPDGRLDDDRTLVLDPS